MVFERLARFIGYTYLFHIIIEMQNFQISKLTDVLYRIQENPGGRSKVVHYDRLKKYQDENKPTWFRQNELV